MSNMTARMAHLLGELRREMNGAVAGAMRYYGAEYGLNYGVSIPTIRALGRDEAKDHKFAKYLFQQEVRELRVVSLWFADPEIVSEELPFWSKGVINSEVAEEGAFVLFSRVRGVEEWLNSDDEVLQYCALLSISDNKDIPLDSIAPRLIKLLETKPSILLTQGIIILLDRSMRRGVEVSQFIETLPINNASNHIRQEMSWR